LPRLSADSPITSRARVRSRGTGSCDRNSTCSCDRPRAAAGSCTSPRHTGGAVGRQWILQQWKRILQPPRRLRHRRRGSCRHPIPPVMRDPDAYNSLPYNEIAQTEYSRRIRRKGSA
jgi:hypothetical protein